MDVAELKRKASESAVDSVASGMAVGLGTGSTAFFVVEAVGRRLKEGSLKNIVCIPTSEQTAEHARKLNIPLTTFEQRPVLDVTIDGADEVAPDLSLVKGLGGALLREKIVAGASKKFVVVVDESKLVDRLGTKAPLPVEVVPFGWECLPDRFRKLGAEPALRRAIDGSVFVTDGQNYILDCRWPGGIADPAASHRELKSLVGVVETGLFIGMASVVIVAGENGIRKITR